MVKMHKLTKGGQTIFPATITDAVVNPNSRKSLTAELSEFSNNVYSPIKEIYVTGVSQLSSPTFNFKKKTDGKLYFNATSNGEIIAAGAWDLNDLKDYVVKSYNYQEKGIYFYFVIDAGKIPLDNGNYAKIARQCVLKSIGDRFNKSDIDVSKILE